MKIIGVTGSSGSGKSTVSNLIKEKTNGIIIDADKIAKKMTNTQSEYLQEIGTVFGKKLIQNNKLNRKQMADIIFCNKEQKEKLNQITFKYVVDEIIFQLNLVNGKSDYVILDVPLLFESKLNEKCNYTVGVISDTDNKIKRICKRDNISQEKAMQRINSQPSDEFYISKCDYIINNSNDELSEKVNELLIKLQ